MTEMSVVGRKVNSNLYDKEAYELHLKRLNNYKRVLLVERDKKNNDPLKHHIERELTSTMLLILLISTVINQSTTNMLPMPFILDERVKIPYHRFQSVVEGRTDFTQAEVNNAILFTLT